MIDITFNPTDLSGDIGVVWGPRAKDGPHRELVEAVLCSLFPDEDPAPAPQQSEKDIRQKYPWTVEDIANMYKDEYEAAKDSGKWATMVGVTPPVPHRKTNPMSEISENIIKVSGSSNPSAVGSILARSVVAGETPKVRAIGASAVNQASKACAIARGFVAPRGIDLAFVLGFDDIVGDSGDTISSMTWRPVKLRG